MTALAEYLLKANLCLIGFYALYYGLLRRHTFFALNRGYLLVAIVASFGLPLIELPEPVVETVSLPIISLPATVVSAQPTGPSPEDWLLGIYGVGVSIFMTLLLVSLWRLARLIRSGDARRQSDHTLVLLPDDRVAPFSFFRYLVLNQTDFAQHPDPIIRHELAHIRQGHSADVLLAELVKIICWPNPVAWLYKRSLQQVHEYLADQQAADKAQYARFLFDYAFQGTANPIANSFFTPALLTQRIRMLYQSRNTNRVLWKYALAIPLLTVLVGLTAARERIAETLTSQPGDTLTILGRVVSEEGKPVRAMVRLAGSTRTRITETDANGRFRLAGVVKSAKLAISSVGFETQFVGLMDNKPVTVTLKRAQKILDEIVVVGYRSEPEPLNDKDELFTVVEQSPEFPGGTAALNRYLGRNIRYPAEAQKYHTSGMVFVQFVVGTDGAIQSPRILKGIGNGCDEEAVRVVSQMPKWKPGQQSGIPVKVQFYLPIRFELEGPAKTSMTTLPQDITSPQSATGSLAETQAIQPKDSTAGKPLYIIDGKEQPKDYDPNKLKPDEVQSVTISKGEYGPKYGEKGKNGVIEITTKAKKP